MKTDDFFDQREEIKAEKDSNDDLLMAFELVCYDAAMSRMADKLDLWGFE